MEQGRHRAPRVRHRRLRRGQAPQEERRRHHAGDRASRSCSSASSRGTRASAIRTSTPRLVTTRFEDIIEDPEIDIVVELIGGTGAALDFQLRALKAGKNVVTANKQLLAQHGAELFAAAEESGRAPPLRGERRRRRPRHQGPARVAGRGRGQHRVRHRQRHDQLHAQRDGRDRGRLRRRAQGGPAARLRRGRPDARTSAARTPRPRWRSSAPSPSTAAPASTTSRTRASRRSRRWTSPTAAGSGSPPSSSASPSSSTAA